MPGGQAQGRPAGRAPLSGGHRPSAGAGLYRYFALLSFFCLLLTFGSEMRRKDRYYFKNNNKFLLFFFKQLFFLTRA
jgi:hypothetical protein